MRVFDNFDTGAEGRLRQSTHAAESCRFSVGERYLKPAVKSAGPAPDYGDRSAASWQYAPSGMSGVS